MEMIATLLAVLLCCTAVDSFVRNLQQKHAGSRLREQPLEKRGPADNDFISNFFSRFLPTPEDIGLKRYDSVSRPENYPCVKDRFADLLPEDKDAVRVS